MTENGSLTTKQRRLIASLLSEPTILGASEKAGVSESTAYRWLRDDPEFKRQMTAAEGEAIDRATRQLIGLQDVAIKTIKTIIDDQATPPGVRLRAAATILDYLLKMRELRNLEQRLADLERKIYEKS